MAQIDAMAANVEKTLYASLDQEVPSKTIGDLVMAELKKVDEISYVRFAAVYRQFKDIETFINFVKSMDSGAKK
jgi:transcriptional repressor NrdR